MSKHELVMRIRNVYPNICERRYPGKTGYKRLYAIWMSILDRRDKQTAEDYK
jgi:hypothetical protein